MKAGDAQRLAEVRFAAERIADVFAHANDPDYLAGLDLVGDVVNNLGDAADVAVRSIPVGDYNAFKFACSLVIASGYTGASRSAWAIGDVAGDLVWRVNRDSFKRDVAEDVERFLAELFPEA